MLLLLLALLFLLLLLTTDGSLLNDFVSWGVWINAIDLPNLAEVTQEVGPHHMVLIDIGALDLRHCNEVIGEEKPVVLADPSNFGQALIAVEEELFSEVLQLLRLLRQHEAEGFLLVEEKLLFTPD